MMESRHLTLPLRALPALLAILAVALSFAAAISTGHAQDAQLPSPAVVLVERPYAVTEFALDKAQGEDMLTRALLTYTGCATPAEAWKALGITPQDVVGIKITCGGGSALAATKQPFVDTIIQGLNAAGVPTSNIIVWDRFPRDMKAAGYAPRPGGGRNVAYTSVFQTGYDKEARYTHEIPGQLMYGDSDFRGKPEEVDLNEEARKAGGGGGVNDIVPRTVRTDQVSNQSYFANIVSKKCTKIINIPAFSENRTVGLSGCMASLALGTVDNNRRFVGESQFGDPAIAEILSNDLLRKKVVLHILDATVAQYAGGPRFNPRDTQPYGAIFMGRDPVAIDTLALERAEEQRKEHNIVPIGKAAVHIKAGEMYNLGTADPKKIKVIKIP